MKKIFALFAFCALLSAAVSCETYKLKDPELTAIGAIDGRYVCFALNPQDVTDTLSVFGVVITNTAANESNRGWLTVTDLDASAGLNWQVLFAVRMPISIDIAKQTFKADAVEAFEPDTAWNPYLEGLYGSYGSYYTVGGMVGGDVYTSTVSGAVVTNGINTASGYKTDGIEFTYTLVDSNNTSVSYLVKGMRKTGWAEDTQEYMDFCDANLW